MDKFGRGLALGMLMIAILCLVLMFYWIVRLSALTRQESGAVIAIETVSA